jgi:HEAT repeat protein
MENHVLKRLCLDLKKRDASVRIRAAEALVQVGFEAVEPLCEALFSIQSYVRWTAAEALGQIGDTRAVAPLCELLADRDSDVRRVAIEALERIGDPAAVEPLCHAVQDSDWKVRMRAVRALEQSGDLRAVKPLCEALSSADEEMAAILGKALTTLADDLDPGTIVSDVRMSPQRRAETWYALQSVRIQRRPILRLPDLLDYCQELRADTTLRLHDAAEEMLRYLTLGRPTLRDPSSDSATLLRPATGPDEPANPDILLRPSSSPEDISG